MSEHVQRSEGGGRQGALVISQGLQEVGVGVGWGNGTVTKR